MRRDRKDASSTRPAALRPPVLQRHLPQQDSNRLDFCDRLPGQEIRRRGAQRWRSPGRSTATGSSSRSAKPRHTSTRPRPSYSGASTTRPTTRRGRPSTSHQRRSATVRQSTSSSESRRPARPQCRVQVARVRDAGWDRRVTEERVLIAVVCGASPAREVDRLVAMAQERGWTVGITATPAVLRFLDVEKLEALTGLPVRSEYRAVDQPRARTLPEPQAVVVAPATFNTVCKLAAGTATTTRLAPWRKRSAGEPGWPCFRSSTPLWHRGIPSREQSTRYAARVSGWCSDQAGGNLIRLGRARSVSRRFHGQPSLTPPASSPTCRARLRRRRPRLRDGSAIPSTRPGSRSMTDNAAPTYPTIIVDAGLGDAGASQPMTRSRVPLCLVRARKARASVLKLDHFEDELVTRLPMPAEVRG
jgi:Flavoprotein